MDTLLTLLALLLPVLMGGLWINLFVPQTSARLALVWGNGTLLGLFVLPQMMRGLDALGMPLNFISTALLAAMICALAATAHYVTRGGRRTTLAQQTPGFTAMPNGSKLLFVFLAALIALRTGSLGLEILWRPLFPWDATMQWATKARVWFEYNSIAPFVDQHAWLETGGEGVFTDRHPHYPGAIPLLQVWMNLATGRWDESLMNLPWLLCFVALGTAFYGQLRLAGIGPMIAMGFTYMLMSMPLVNIHVALAGYADLFLAAAYCGTLMALHNWGVTRQSWLAGLAVIFAVACPLIKNEGLIWALTLLPALAVALMPRRQAAKLFLMTALWAVLILLLIPDDMEFAGHTLYEMRPQFHPQGLLGTIKSVWLHDNWHLFGYLLLGIIPLGLVMPGAMLKSYLAISAALGSAVGLFLFLFLFTGFGWGASNFTAVGRLSIQLAPGLLFLSALLFNELMRRDTIFSRPETAASAN